MKKSALILTIAIAVTGTIGFGCGKGRNQSENSSSNSSTQTQTKKIRSRFAKVNQVATAHDYFEILRGTRWYYPGGSDTDYIDFDQNQLILQDWVGGLWVSYSTNHPRCQPKELTYQDANGCFHCVTFQPNPNKPGEYFLNDSYKNFNFVFQKLL